MALAIPEQVIPLAELAGSWNALKYFRDPINGINNFSPETYVLNFDAAGTITSATNTGAIGGTLSVNQSGGYDIGGSATELPSRVFAFKTADGHLSMFLLYSGNRGISVLSKQSSLSLPGVGAVSNFWDLPKKPQR